MDKYLRFGEIQENERSINFLRLSFEENERFSDDMKAGSYKNAVSNLPKDCLESGISCFHMDADGLPRLDNIALIRSLASRLDACVYEVTGDMTGEGNDGDPLIKNVTVIKKRRIRKEKLVNKIIRVMVSNFRDAKKTGESGSLALLKFVRSEKINIVTGERCSRWSAPDSAEWVALPDRPVYTFDGWEFSDPMPGFIEKR